MRSAAQRPGPPALVALAGEPFVEMGQAIERRLHADLGVEELLTVSDANGSAGYPCPVHAYTEGNSEAERAPYNYHRSGPFTDATEERLTKAVVAHPGRSAGAERGPGWRARR